MLKSKCLALGAKHIKLLGTRGKHANDLALEVTPQPITWPETPKNNYLALEAKPQPCTWP